MNAFRRTTIRLALILPLLGLLFLALDNVSAAEDAAVVVAILATLGLALAIVRLRRTRPRTIAGAPVPVAMTYVRLLAAAALTLGVFAPWARYAGLASSSFNGLDNGNAVPGWHLGVTALVASFAVIGAALWVGSELVVGLVASSAGAAAVFVVISAIDFLHATDKADAACRALFCVEAPTSGWGLTVIWVGGVTLIVSGIWPLSRVHRHRLRPRRAGTPHRGTGC